MKTIALLAASLLWLLAGCAGSGDPDPAGATPAATVASATPTAGADDTPVPSPTATAPATPPATPASTESPTLGEDSTPTATETPDPPAETSTPTETSPPTDTPTITLTPTITRTPTNTGTPTPTLGPGANIRYFGILRADGTVVEPIEFDELDRPVYPRPFGSGFVIVVEARRGTSNAAVARVTFDYDPEDPDLRPDLQIQSDQDLGDGNPEVCDHLSPTFGGIPGVAPPSFEPGREISDVLNDFGCLFVDGTGAPLGRNRNESCVLKSDGQYDFVNLNAEVQFCAQIPVPVRFPVGDVILTAQVRDTQGVTGPVRQIVVRVGGPQ